MVVESNGPGMALGSSISLIRRDATSASVFWTLGIEMTDGQTKWVVRCRIARP
jgi:hypothetical protein